MKNKLSHSIKILTFLIAAAACTDLEMASDGRDSLGSVFANYTKAKSYYQSIIGAMPKVGSSAYYGTLLSSFSDEAQDVDDITSTQVTLWYAGGVTAVMNPLTLSFDPWSHYFITIRRCNTFLQAMDDPQMLAFDIGETEKSGWMAQVRVIRAFAYLQLMKRYGAVPIMDTPVEVDHDYSKTVRNTVEEVTDFILADCDSALATPEKEADITAFRWSLTEGDRGVISRAFAWAVKSEAALCAASPLFYQSGSKYTWDEAAKVTRAALAACVDHNFRLYNTAVLPAVAQSPYAYYFIQRSDPSRQQDKETIFESSYQLSIWSNHGTAGAWRGVTSAGSCPSQELVDAYETTDGQPVLDLNKPYNDADHLQPNYNTASIYEPSDPYANRDPRFYASIYYNGAPRTLVGNAPVSLTFGSVSGSALTITPGEEEGEVTIKAVNTSSSGYVRTLAFPIPKGDDSIFFSFEYKSLTDGKDVKLRAIKDLTLSLPKTDGDEWGELKINITANGGFGNDGGDMTHLRLYAAAVKGYEITMRNIRVGPEKFVEPPVVETFIGGNSELRSEGLTNTRTGYYLRKYNNHRSDVDVSSDGYMKIYRLGELYLNFAEAAYNAVGPDADVSGMTARAAVNAVRTRAGMPELPAGMSKEEFEKRYRNERRVELAFEEKRFFDVRRWKILGETDGFVTGMKITKNPQDGTFAYERVKLRQRSCSDEKFLLFPISQTEVAKMNALTGGDWQNPGW
jgi:hypothetical protein